MPASIAAGIGGLTFIVLKGTIGRVMMDVAFTGYGALIGMGWNSRGAPSAMMRAMKTDHRFWSALPPKTLILISSFFRLMGKNRVFRPILPPTES